MHGTDHRLQLGHGEQLQEGEGDFAVGVIDSDDRRALTTSESTNADDLEHVEIRVLRG